MMKSTTNRDEAGIVLLPILLLANIVWHCGDHVCFLRGSGRLLAESDRGKHRRSVLSVYRARSSINGK